MDNDTTQPEDTKGRRLEPDAYYEQLAYDQKIRDEHMPLIGRLTGALLAARNTMAARNWDAENHPNPEESATYQMVVDAIAEADPLMHWNEAILPPMGDLPKCEFIDAIRDPNAPEDEDE